MDGRRAAGSLNDAALEREVEGLLAVEPSPEFVARVRAHVAGHAAPRPWVFRWQFAAAAGVAVLLAVVIVWRSQGATGSANDLTSTTTAPDVVQRAPLPPPPTRVEGVTPQKAVDRPAPQRLARSRSRATTEVSRARDLTPVLAAADGKAFDRLLATIREPDVVLVLSTGAPGPPWLETSTITIEPVAIDPVPPVEQLEGGVE